MTKRDKAFRELLGIMEAEMVKLPTAEQERRTRAFERVVARVRARRARTRRGR